jgi:hypothetical protein
MTVQFLSQPPAENLVLQNLRNKGFLDTHPTPGCTYVMQPPKPYQNLFQELQAVLTEAGLSTANVRIPHATIIAAKVVDRNPNETWKNLEGVQRVYRAFLLYHVEMLMSSGSSYPAALLLALQPNDAALSDIAATTTENEALGAIQDREVRDKVAQFPASHEKYKTLRASALEAINEASFQLQITTVKLTTNGSILFELSSDDKLLKMRLDLIIAGQGIPKWKKLSQMKNAWSTVGYTTKLLTEAEHTSLSNLLDDWTTQNQARLRAVRVEFAVAHLSMLAFRSNDFYIAKKAVFPLSKPSRLNIHIYETNEVDLSLTPYAGNGGVTPINGNRTKPIFGKENWSGPFNREITAPTGDEKEEIEGKTNLEMKTGAAPSSRGIIASANIAKNIDMAMGAGKRTICFPILM